MAVDKERLLNSVIDQFGANSWRQCILFIEDLVAHGASLERALCEARQVANDLEDGKAGRYER